MPRGQSCWRLGLDEVPVPNYMTVFPPYSPPSPPFGRRCREGPGQARHQGPRTSMLTENTSGPIGQPAKNDPSLGSWFLSPQSCFATLTPLTVRRKARLGETTAPSGDFIQDTSPKIPAMRSLPQSNYAPVKCHTCKIGSRSKRFAMSATNDLMKSSLGRFRA